MPTYKKQATVSTRLKYIHVPAGPALPSVKSNFLQHLVKRLFKVLRFFDSPQEPSLQGRIHELKSHADNYHVQLLKIKSQFDKEVDVEAYTFIEAIIDPLLKEVTSMQSIFIQGNAAQQAKIFKKYGEWIERARVWVHFHARVSHKQQIIDAVVHHLIGAALTCIDRDRQIIQDYQIHQLASLNLKPEAKLRLEEEMQRSIQPYLDRLKILKQRPKVISLDELAKWKEKIDENRQVYFENALHAVDILIEQEAPFNYSVEANEHLCDALSETAYLEREVAALHAEIERGVSTDSIVCQALSDHLTALAEEVHRLTLDMRLGWDLIERLQQVNLAITLLRKKLPQRSIY
jgi:hypothetical protein